MPKQLPSISNDCLNESMNEWLTKCMHVVDYNSGSAGLSMAQTIGGALSAACVSVAQQIMTCNMRDNVPQNVRIRIRMPLYCHWNVSVLRK